MGLPVLPFLLGTAAVAVVVQGVRKKWWQQTVRLFRILVLLRAMDAEKKPQPVRSNPDAVAWPEPETDAVPDGRTLWGFWDAGEDDMPMVCQLAVRSWRVRNPDWGVIILSDANYKTYVSLSDLPSTFDSLIPQHRADILRIAVLLRYGGIYLDASTFVYRAFDQVWDELDDKSVALSPSTIFPGTDLLYYNNAVIMAKTPQNAVLLEWQKRVNVYMEDPCMTNEAVLAHPSFERSREYLQCDAMGVMGQALPYGALLWLLNDMIWFEKPLQSLVLQLPMADYGVGLFTLNHYYRQFDAERKSKQYSGEITGDLSLAGLMKECIYNLRVYTSLDRDLVDDVVPKLAIIKMSTAGFQFVNLEDPCTEVRILQAAADSERFLTKQTSIAGARRAQHTPGKAP